MSSSVRQSIMARRRSVAIGNISCPVFAAAQSKFGDSHSIISKERESSRRKERAWRSSRKNKPGRIVRYPRSAKLISKMRTVLQTAYFGEAVRALHRLKPHPRETIIAADEHSDHCEPAGRHISARREVRSIRTAGRFGNYRGCACDVSALHRCYQPVAIHFQASRQ